MAWCLPARDEELGESVAILIRQRIAMRSPVIFFLGLSFSFTISVWHASAQAWRDGFVVMVNGDSVKGQIEFSDPDENITRIRFRSSPSSTPVPYSPAEINSFGIDNPPQRFEKLEAQVSYYSKGIVEWGDNPVVAIKLISSFAEVIRASRSVTLYSVYDENGDERFFLRKNGELTELRNISYLVMRDANTYTVNETPYRGQIMNLLAGCPEVKKKVYQYDGKSLGKAVEDYAKCKGETSTVTTSLAQETWFFGGFVLVGTGTLNGEAIGWGGTAGVSAQMLSRKNRGNQFWWIDLGVGDSDILSIPLFLNLSVGSYIGNGRVQPLIDAGVSTLSGTLNGGLGVAYNKRVVLAGNINVGLLGEKTVLYTMKLTVYPRLRRKG
jgi:hypothetical protein